jgi:Domain of unknown function (DUF4160)
MPTVLRIDGYEIMIYLHDHRPAHVHVSARGYELVVNLNQPPAYVSVRNNKGFKTQEIASILRIVQNHRDRLCEMWKGIHGDI